MNSIMLKFYKPYVHKLLYATISDVNCQTYFSSKKNNKAQKFYDHQIEPIVSYTSASNDLDNFFSKPRQVWLENLDTVSEHKLGLVELNPDVFGMQPRIDIIHENIRWQKLYRFVVCIIYKINSVICFL